MNEETVSIKCTICQLMPSCYNNSIYTEKHDTIALFPAANEAAIINKHKVYEKDLKSITLISIIIIFIR